MGTSTTSTSITLSWSPPAQGTVQSYKLTITGGGGPATVSPPSTTHMFSSLTPFTQYMVTIAAVDSMGREGDSTTITVTTDRAGIYYVEIKMHKKNNYITIISLTHQQPFCWSPTTTNGAFSEKRFILQRKSTQLLENE